jgi:SAM-dependent methyltransferase
MAGHRLYDELARWWPLFSPPEHYSEEAAHLLQLINEAGPEPPRTMVEFGSGGGSNAFHLKRHFRLTLVDLSPAMVAISRSYNPECEHLVGDMRSVRLGRVFDAVFIHDAIMYMTTEADLRRALETAWTHCAAGGTAVLVPDCVRETFQASTSHGGEDGVDRGLRYLEWQFDPDPSDTSYSAHFAFLLREGGQMHVERDEHTFGLFVREHWLQLLRQVGFEPRAVVDPYGRDIFVAAKPRA